MQAQHVGLHRATTADHGDDAYGAGATGEGEADPEAAATEARVAGPGSPASARDPGGFFVRHANGGEPEPILSNKDDTSHTIPLLCADLWSRFSFPDEIISPFFSFCFVFLLSDMPSQTRARVRTNSCIYVVGIARPGVYYTQ